MTTNTAAACWPLRPDAPRRRLTAEERAHYDAQGFVEVPEVFTPEELDAVNAEIDRLRSEVPRDKDDTGIYQLGLRSPMTAAVCQDERLLTLIEGIVKPGIAIYSAKMIEKQPQNAQLCHWHQDNAYYNLNSTSVCRMSIWIPLQDCDQTNGCLWVVPGSHKTGQRDAQTYEDGHCRLAFARATESIEGEVAFPIKAGSVLLFDAYLWHCSRGNQTDRIRRSYIVSYQEATCPRGNGAQHKVLRPA